MSCSWFTLACGQVHHGPLGTPHPREGITLDGELMFEVGTALPRPRQLLFELDQLPALPGGALAPGVGLVASNLGGTGHRRRGTQSESLGGTGHRTELVTHRRDEGVRH